MRWKLQVFAASMTLLVSCQVGAALATTVHNFDSLTSGVANLPGQDTWVHLKNWYGPYPAGFAAAGVAASGGIGNSQFGYEDAAVVPVRPEDTHPNGDVEIRVMVLSRESDGALSRLLVGNDGLADHTVALHGVRLFLNSGGDATYQVGTSGDTSNPGITGGINFGPFGWFEVQLYSRASDSSLGNPNGTVGTLQVSWRDVDDSTGAPLAAFTSLGKIPQSYGTPTYFGYLANSGGGHTGIDNLRIIPEPATMTLLGIGLSAVGCAAWRRRRTGHSRAVSAAVKLAH